MSVRSQALVPLSTEQQAAWRAVAVRIFMKGDHSITSIEIG